MHRGEHGGETDVADTTKDNVECHVNFGIFPGEFFRGDVNATAGGYDDTNGLVYDVDALEDVDRIIVIGRSNSENVNRVDQAINDAVLTFNANN